jgi:hypothetical protein
MGSSHLAKQHTIRQMNRHDQIDISLYLSLCGFRLQEGMRERVCVNQGLMSIADRRINGLPSHLEKPEYLYDYNECLPQSRSRIHPPLLFREPLIYIPHIQNNGKIGA